MRYFAILVAASLLVFPCAALAHPKLLFGDAFPGAIVAESTRTEPHTSERLMPAFPSLSVGTTSAAAILGLVAWPGALEPPISGM